MTTLEQKQTLIFTTNAEISALAAKLRTSLSASEYRATLDQIREAQARKAGLFIPNHQSAFGS